MGLLTLFTLAVHLRVRARARSEGAAERDASSPRRITRRSSSWPFVTPGCSILRQRRIRLRGSVCCRRAVFGRREFRDDVQRAAPIRDAGREALAKAAGGDGNGSCVDPKEMLGYGLTHIVTNHMIVATEDGAVGKHRLLTVGVCGYPHLIELQGGYEDEYVKTQRRVEVQVADPRVQAGAVAPVRRLRESCGRVPRVAGAASRRFGAVPPVRLDAQGGPLTVALAESLQIPVGRVTWIRLHFAGTSFVRDNVGAEHTLRCPSCDVTENNGGRGFKVNRTFEVTSDGLGVMVDIDLLKSLHEDSNGYALRPTARIEAE